MSTEPVDLNAPLRALADISINLRVIQNMLMAIREILQDQTDLMRGTDRWKTTTTKPTTSKATKTAKPPAKTR